MLNFIDSYMEQKNIFFITSVSIVLIGILGILDYITGYELHISIFYLIPIYIGSWHANKNTGLLLCCISTVVSIVANHFAGLRFSHSSIVYWNILVRFSFFLLISHLISNLKVNYDKEKDLSCIDGLTGAMNLRIFKETSEALFKVAKRSKSSISICYIDVDNFKNLNDTHGHDEGDRVLQVIAATLKSSVRKSDLVGRLGGDEFSILLYETELEGAKIVADRMLEQLRKKTIIAKSTIGFSIGVAVFGTPPSSAQEAIKCADTLMYRAKKTGKNKIVYEVFS